MDYIDYDELFIELSALPQKISQREVYLLIDKMNKDGDEQAFNKVVIHNIRLVIHQIMNRFRNVNYDRKELVSIGIMGLIKAVRSFDTSREIKFSTYATRCIDNEILLFLRQVKKDEKRFDLEDTVSVDSDGNELRLEDIISDSTNIEEEYEKKITNELIREIVTKLPYRDKEIIMMYFGFYNDKQYSQEEIATKLNIGRSSVSRIITQNLEKIGKLLEKEGIIDSNSFTKKEKRRTNIGKRLQSIYKYFSQYTREEVEQMLTKLTNEEKQLLRSRYGDDLDNPVTSADWDKEKNSKFYFKLFPKMKKLLEESEYISSQDKKSKKIRVITGKTDKEDTKDSKSSVSIPPMEHNLEEETDNRDLVTTTIVEAQDVSNKEIDNEEKITVEDSIRLLEYLKTPELEKIIKELSIEKFIILSLRLGYINGKYFSASSIAEFLKIDKQEVIDIVKEVLTIYKQNIVSKLECSIEESSKELTLNYVL